MHEDTPCQVVSQWNKLLTCRLSVASVARCHGCVSGPAQVTGALWGRQVLRVCCQVSCQALSGLIQAACCCKELPLHGELASSNSLCALWSNRFLCPGRRKHALQMDAVLHMPFMRLRAKTLAFIFGPGPGAYCRGV